MGVNLVTIAVVALVGVVVFVIVVGLGDAVCLAVINLESIYCPNRIFAP